ncbi:hypothetical protein Tco_1104053 [Tanacetum coccineum]
MANHCLHYVASSVTHKTIMMVSVHLENFLQRSTHTVSLFLIRPSRVGSTNSVLQKCGREDHRQYFSNLVRTLEKTSTPPQHKPTPKSVRLPVADSMKTDHQTYEPLIRPQLLQLPLNHRMAFEKVSVSAPRVGRAQVLAIPLVLSRNLGYPSAIEIFVSLNFMASPKQSLRLKDINAQIAASSFEVVCEVAVVRVGLHSNNAAG